MGTAPAVSRAADLIEAMRASALNDRPLERG
jgi:hypothetical protein